MNGSFVATCNQDNSTTTVYYKVIHGEVFLNLINVSFVWNANATQTNDVIFFGLPQFLQPSEISQNYLVTRAWDVSDVGSTSDFVVFITLGSGYIYFPDMPPGRVNGGVWTNNLNYGDTAAIYNTQYIYSLNNINYSNSNLTVADCVLITVLGCITVIFVIGVLMLLFQR